MANRHKFIKFYRAVWKKRLHFNRSACVLPADECCLLCRIGAEPHKRGSVPMKRSNIEKEEKK
jgi:hypothetical protein